MQRPCWEISRCVHMMLLSSSGAVDITLVFFFLQVCIQYNRSLAIPSCNLLVADLTIACNPTHCYFSYYNCCVCIKEIIGSICSIPHFNAQLLMPIFLLETLIKIIVHILRQLFQLMIAYLSQLIMILVVLKKVITMRWLCVVPLPMMQCVNFKLIVSYDTKKKPQIHTLNYGENYVRTSVRHFYVFDQFLLYV